jgi:solute carrier family 10 (sodium/bile acid cotransporter), member 7
MQFIRRIIPDPFLLVLVGTLLFATLLPARGVFASAVSWLANIAIVLLFFFHGAKLSRDSVLSGLTHWRMHAVILLCTFAMFPVVGFALSKLFPGLLSPVLWAGVLYLVALPSTVQSSIAFVSMAKGNVSAAIASASASQVVGVFVTPVLVALMTNVHGEVNSMAGIGKVASLILLPFVIGHSMRPWIGEWVARYKATIAITDRTTIVIAVYSAFSAAVIEGIWQRLPLIEFVKLFLLCVALLCFALVFTRAIAKLCKFNREDEIVVVFCGTKKSLVQGVPMARVLFSGPDLGLILIPIMIFHQMQLMVCAWIARKYLRQLPDE